MTTTSRRPAVADIVAALRREAGELDLDRRDRRENEAGEIVGLAGLSLNEEKWFEKVGRENG